MFKLRSCLLLFWSLIAFAFLAGCVALKPEIEPLPPLLEELRKEEPGGTILYEVLYGDASSLRSLLEKNGPIASTDRLLTPPLHMATRLHKNDMVAMLLDAGADPRTWDVLGLNCLAVAAEQGNPTALELLLRSGVSPDEKSQNGFTALMCAAAGPMGEAAYFRSYDRHSNQFFRKNRAYAQCVKLLLKAGADVYAESEVGVKAIDLALGAGNHEIARILKVEANRR